jgi:hypothetical protein
LTLRVFFAVFFTALFAFFFAFLAILPSDVRWLSSLCAFGNRNALHSEYTQRAKKDSVPLKEVLMRRRANMRDA